MHEQEPKSEQGPKLQVEALGEKHGVWPFRKRRYFVYQIDRIDKHGMTHRTEVLEGEFRNGRSALRAAEEKLKVWQQKR